MTKRRNKSKQPRRVEADVSLFVQKYARKSAKADPNDRSYNKQIARIVKRMKPEDLDRILRGEDT